MLHGYKLFSSPSSLFRHSLMFNFFENQQMVEKLEVAWAVATTITTRAVTTTTKYILEKKRMKITKEKTEKDEEDE